MTQAQGTGVGTDGWCSPVADMSDERRCHSPADRYSWCGVCTVQRREFHPVEMEDLFSPGDHLQLSNASFGTSSRSVPLGTDRIIACPSRATGAPFTEHGRPACSPATACRGTSSAGQNGLADALHAGGAFGRVGESHSSRRAVRIIPSAPAWRAGEELHTGALDSRTLRLLASRVAGVPHHLSRVCPGSGRGLSALQHLVPMGAPVLLGLVCFGVRIRGLVPGWLAGLSGQIIHRGIERPGGKRSGRGELLERRDELAVFSPQLRATWPTSAVVCAPPARGGASGQHQRGQLQAGAVIA